LFLVAAYSKAVFQSVIPNSFSLCLYLCQILLNQHIQLAFLSRAATIGKLRQLIGQGSVGQGINGG
jgi:hypothetical protein